MKIRKAGCGCFFRIYNWCGPGCSGPEPPLNDVDTCCQSHDICYDTNSSPCHCDREFIRCLCKNINFTSKEGIVAALIYAYMNIQLLFTCTFLNRS